MIILQSLLLHTFRFFNYFTPWHLHPKNVKKSLLFTLNHPSRGKNTQKFAFYGKKHTNPTLPLHYPYITPTMGLQWTVARGEGYTPLAILSVLHVPDNELYEDCIQQDEDSSVSLAKG
jgi:hypothetical protein